MTVAIGRRILDLFVGFDVTLYRPATDDTVTYYWSNKSWQTSPDDTVAPNRQYVGQVISGLDYVVSWFQGTKVGGRSKRNYGTIVLADPDGTHSLDVIFSGAYSAQGQAIICRLGVVGEDLADMIPLTLQGRQIRPSSDGRTVELDLADEGQALEGDIFQDRFQGLGFAVRHGPGKVSTIPDALSLDPASAFYVEIAYRLPPSFSATSATPIGRVASGGGFVYALSFTAGQWTVESRTSADATTTLTATDLVPAFDGRVHRFGGKWTGAVLEAFHSTRTGGVKSADSLAQTSIKAGTGVLGVGDIFSLINTHDYIDIVEIRLYLDANVPTDAEIIDRMKRPLTTAEIAECELYVKCQISGTTPTWTSADETGNGHTLTPHATAEQVPTFEGKDEMAGKAKPIALGRTASAPVVWADKSSGHAVVHSGTYCGCPAVFDGAQRFSVGWPKRAFYAVDFVAASNTIKLPTRTDAGSNSRLDAQPCFIGPVSGQQFIVSGTASNDGTKTLSADATEDTLTVASGIVNETFGETAVCYIEMLAAAGAPVDAQLWHEAGAILFPSVPSGVPTVELFGDIGRDESVAHGSGYHFPDYVTGLVQRIIQKWSSVVLTTPDLEWTVASAIAQAGKWLDPSRSLTVREVVDDCADTPWMRWGPDQANSGQWSFLSVIAPPGTPEVTLTALEILGLRRLRNVEPVAGFTLRCAVNYRQLTDGEVLGSATDDDREMLLRPYLEVSAVPDPAVLDAFPFAELPPAVTTWLRNAADAQVEVQRRYDILSVEREVFEAKVVLYGLNQNPLACEVNVTDADFGSLVSGKDLWLVQLQAKDEKVTMTLWG